MSSEYLAAFILPPLVLAALGWLAVLLHERSAPPEEGAPNRTRPRARAAKQAE